MNLETKVSYFKGTKHTSVLGNFPISKALEWIKDGKFEPQITKLRAGDKSVKTQLPTVAMHGIFDLERRKDDFIEASGLVILDIDDVEIGELESIKQDIFDLDESVVACMKSPSGNGIKILYYIEPNLINADNYRQIGKQLVQEYSQYGDVDYLSVTDCLIMTWDPNILINEDARPAHILIEQEVERTSELEPLDESRALWDDAAEFFETVLESNISEKTNNNFHYIQVSILDLKKFGFEHPKEDLSFVIDFAESHFKRSSENKTRFL